MSCHTNKTRDQWNLRKRIGFRFLFTYFILYTIFDYISYAIPYGGDLEDWLRPIWKFLVPPVGEYIFGIDREIYIGPHGSGDTTADYIKVFIKFISAVTITIIWTIVDRNRIEYSRLKRFFFVYLRYFLGGVMLTYGFMKVFPLQFSEPPLQVLVKNYGDFTPMGVLWYFMGVSSGYTIFTGLAEVIGGLLLFNRKTLRLGVFIIIGVIINIVMLNFCYNVPVKLFSSHLLLMGIILFWSDLKRYANFLVLNRSVIPSPIQPYYSKPLWNRLTLLLKILFISLLLLDNISEKYKSYINREERLATSLYGIHKVDNFKIRSISDSTQHQSNSSVSDSIRWHQLVIHSSKYTRIYFKDDTNDLMKYKIDSIKQTIAFTSLDSTQLFTLDYQQPTSDSLLLNGVVNRDTLEIKMHLFPKDSFLLKKRKFNWILE